MKLSAPLALAASALIPGALAHGTTEWYKFSNPLSYYKGWNPYNPYDNLNGSIQRPYSNNGPVDYTTKAITCNGNNSFADKVATVAAGSEVTFYWNAWPHAYGPVLDYMAKCTGDCRTFDASVGNVWFKIDHDGYTNGQWAQTKLQAQNNTWTTTIPSCLAPGNYLLRHELIALHSPNAPQFYPSCAQLTVTGSGSTVPSTNLVALPGEYVASHPGIGINIYVGFNGTYSIPGPPVFKC